MLRCIVLILASSLVACSGANGDLDLFGQETPKDVDKTSTSPTSPTSPDTNEQAKPPPQVDQDAGSEPSPLPPTETQPDAEAPTPQEPPTEPPPPPPPPPVEDCPEIHNEFCQTDVYPLVYNRGYPITCVSKYQRFNCAEVTYLGSPMYCCR